MEIFSGDGGLETCRHLSLGGGVKNLNIKRPTDSEGPGWGEKVYEGPRNCD